MRLEWVVALVGRKGLPGDFVNNKKGFNDMKTLSKLALALVLCAVAGFTLSACDDSSSSGTSSTFTISNGA